MVRAQVYFDEQEYEAVRQEAFKKRLSISAIIRRLVDDQILGRKTERKKKATGLLSLVGMFRETKPDVSERHDDYLWEK